MKKLIITLTSLVSLTLLSGCNTADASQNDQSSGDSNVLNIYSSRHYDIDLELADRFTELTGITVNMLQGNGHEILERAIRESSNPQADLFINVGAITMYTALQEGILEPHNSSVVSNTVRDGLYGTYWAGLATRARIIVYDNQSDDYINITRYSDLADEFFRNSILVRSSTNLYNVALVAALLQVYGEEEAGLFIDGMVNNMARAPQGNDRDQMRAIVAGEGRYGITNNYYLQMMLTSSDPADVVIGERMGWMFPDYSFEDISWAGVINGAENRDNAIRFIEFLLEEEQQQTIMQFNGEAPANKNVGIISELAAQNDFERMAVNFETLGRYSTRASIMMDLAGWE